MFIIFRLSPATVKKTSDGKGVGDPDKTIEYHLMYQSPKITHLSDMTTHSMGDQNCSRDRDFSDRSGLMIAETTASHILLVIGVVK